MGTRFMRSASQPMGTAPRTKKAAEAVPMKTMAPSAHVEGVLDLGSEDVDGRALRARRARRWR